MHWKVPLSVGSSYFLLRVCFLIVTSQTYLYRQPRACFLMKRKYPYIPCRTHASPVSLARSWPSMYICHYFVRLPIDSETICSPRKVEINGFRLRNSDFRLSSFQFDFLILKIPLSLRWLLILNSDSSTDTSPEFPRVRRRRKRSRYVQNKISFHPVLEKKFSCLDMKLYYWW